MDISTPVLILGGKENALSLARRLGRLGVAVRVSGPASCWALYSRYCRQRFPIGRGQGALDLWRRLLLSPARDLDGHILLACSDEAIEFIAEHHAELSGRYVLGDLDPRLMAVFLDKMRTLELARSVGIDAPGFWKVKSTADLDKLRGEIGFPILVKPIHSHKFFRVFGRKLFIVEQGFDELKGKVELVERHGLDVMLMEMIPGPDDLLSSYYSYIDAEGRSLFHYTKRIVRRYPTNRGLGCYHVAEWLPETAERGRALFASAGIRGFANVEFKRDRRDNKLKIIEVNGRFTAAQPLIVRSGAPIDLIVYCHMTGQSPPRFDGYEQDLRYWYPLRDFLAFLELRRRGELNLSGWIRSVAGHRQVFPLFDRADVVPSLGAAGAAFQQLARGRA